jgi:hypothetical protein
MDNSELTLPTMGFRSFLAAKPSVKVLTSLYVAYYQLPPLPVKRCIEISETSEEGKGGYGDVRESGVMFAP